MAANYHNRFNTPSPRPEMQRQYPSDEAQRQYTAQAYPPQHQQHSHSVGRGGEDEEVEQVIDPNLYGPFGTRYHDDYPHPHTHHNPANSSGWHEVPAVEHDRRPSGTTGHWEGEVIPLSQTLSISEKPLIGSAQPTPLDEAHSHAGPGLHKVGHRKSGSLFDIVHAKGSAHKPHIVEYGEEIPLNFGHLIKRPVIRQWLHGGHLYREKDERKPSQFELFFDLIFVAVVNGLGHATAEASSAVNAFKFVLSFWPCFSIWTDVRVFLNTSGTDDVVERLFLLGWMILLCGYCANISGVKIVYATEELLAAMLGGESGLESGSDAGSAGESSHGGGHRRRALHLASALLRRAGGGGGSEEEAVLSQPVFGGYWFTEGYDTAIHAAIAFFLVAKCWRLGIYLYYGLALPKFRQALWLNALANTLIAAIYIPILFTSNPLLIVLLLVAGIIVELLRSYSVAVVMMCFHGRKKRSGNHMFIPALSHEHSIERYVLFVILIIGESIISSTFVATEGTYGLNSEFGRAALGITISFFVTWLYYDADASRVFQHALRRNAFTSISFCHIHFPLTAALILMAASLSRLISENDVSQGYVWYFGASLACVMGCIGCIGLMHRNLDVYGSSLVPRWMRLVVRFIAAAAFAILPIKGDWASLNLMGLYAAILAAVVAFETVGKVGAIGRRYDADKAAEFTRENSHSHKAQLDRRASWHPFDDLTGTERGEEDVGVESEIGHLEQKNLAKGERWAYAA